MRQTRRDSISLVLILVNVASVARTIDGQTLAFNREFTATDYLETIAVGATGLYVIVTEAPPMGGQAIRSLA